MKVSTISILSGVLLLLAAGCSKNAMAPVSAPSDGSGSWVDNPSLPVPIQFSSYGMSDETKAVRPGMIEGTSMSNLDVGIFALAVTDDHKPADTGVSSDNKFNTHQYPQTWRLSDEESLLLTNEKVTTGDEGYIEMKDKYYPLTDTYQYSFYSYYPYQEEVRSQTSSDGDYYTAEYELGNTDILYAYDDAYRFKSYADQLGFNAGYIRFLKKYEDRSQYYSIYKPKLVYGHLLAALIVNANSTADNANIRIQKVELIDVYTSATLYIADSRKSGNMSGKIEPVGNPDGNIIVLKGGDNGEKTDFSDIVLGTDYRELSKFIVFPGSETHPVTKFTMNVTFGIYVNGTLSGNTVTKTATVTPPRNKTVFEAGKKYNVNITVDDALNIELIETSLNEFDEGGDTGFTWN